MPKLLLRCEKCYQYSMRQLKIRNQSSNNTENKIIEDTTSNNIVLCPNCNGAFKTPHPARFSIDNRWLGYLRRMKALANNSDSDIENSNIK